MFVRIGLLTSASFVRSFLGLRALTSSVSSQKTRIEPWLRQYLDSDCSHEVFKGLSDEQKRIAIELDRTALRECGEQSPAQIPDTYWPELLTQTIRERHQLFKYLYLRESFAEQKAAEREAKLSFMKLKQHEREQRIQKGLPASTYPGYSCYFTHIGPRQESYIDRSRFVAAHRLDNRIYIDCGFEHIHRLVHLKYVAEQIVLCSGMNKLYTVRVNKNTSEAVTNGGFELYRTLGFTELTSSVYERPFALTLCNFSVNSTLGSLVEERGPIERLMLDYTSKDILDCEPIDRLVYLSPHAETVMKEYDPDKRYVIGGLIDKPSRPITYAKCKELGIHCEKLPLDRYLKFDGGTKEMTIDQTLNIITTLASCYANWETALKWVPQRKLKKIENDDTWGLSIGLK